MEPVLKNPIKFTIHFVTETLSAIYVKYIVQPADKGVKTSLVVSKRIAIIAKSMC